MEYTAKIGDLVWFKGAGAMYAAVVTNVYVQKWTSTVDGVFSEHEATHVAVDYCTGRRWYDKVLDGQGYSGPANNFDGRFLARPVLCGSSVTPLPHSECVIISDHAQLDNWLSEKAAA